MQRRIVFGLAGFALVSWGLMTFAVWLGGSHGIYEEVGMTLEKDSRTHLTALKKFVDECRAEVVEWSRKPEFRNASAGVALLENSLGKLRSRCLPYQSVMVFSGEGKVLMGWRSMSDFLGQQVVLERWLRNTPAVQATVHWIATPDQPARPHLVIAAPILSEGERRRRKPRPSLLAAAVDGTRLTRLLPHVAGGAREEGGSAHWLLVNGRGKILARSDNTAELSILYKNLADQSLHFSGLHGHRVEQLGKRRWIVGFSSLATAHASLPGWQLFWMRDGASVSPVVSRWIQWTVLLGGLLVLIALGLGWILGRRIQRPIMQLVDVANSIQRSGSLHLRGDVQGSDEIALLSRSFNQMLEALTEKTVNLIRCERGVREEHRTTTQLIVSGLAHQLNNPLSGMMDCVEELESGVLDAKTSREYVDFLARGLDRIHHIVSRLSGLDLTAGDREHITEVESVVRAVIGLRQVQIERKSLRIELTADAWIVVRVDPSVFSDIIDNLLCNAIQASRDGGTIRISITQGNMNNVKVLVEDRGVGMKQDEVAHIFEPFYSRRTGGVGLGMWTVQAYIDALGGAIEVDSVPDEGTTVRVYVPDAGGSGYGATI